MPGIKDVAAVIMGGGRGTRLYPLTRNRAKPAIPLAGKYRLIDIPISNCINSGIFRISVLTQFNSASLNRHVSQTYHIDPFGGGYVEILAAEQTEEHSDWYQGTADAVRKQLSQLRSECVNDVLILAGDHLYRMDYSRMTAAHWERGADITVGVVPIDGEDVARFGVLKQDDTGCVTAFAEKPRDPAVQAAMVSYPDRNQCYLGSMGIYVFKLKVLIDILTNYPEFVDFGGDVIPWAVSHLKVCAYEFDDYWRDIGTIRSFYETNLELTRPDAPFRFYDPRGPIYTHTRFLPGCLIEDSSLQDVMLAEGCQIRTSSISYSVLGVRSRISRGCIITDSIVMGADQYEPMNGALPGLGENCYIHGAIIDKNVSLGAGSTIKAFPRGTEIDERDYVVRDGIVVIPKNTVLPPGTVIEPEPAARQLNLTY
ncbi:Nucleotidyl transferase [Dehalogenimonas lykanthroporepellens BL-DC-9]|jgi:glucose-1-phosphate adenylyltransferase|nr:Nucleotidyl transferase [Dehalogenimonas lykanthroporepellens BL-DC-9]